jgi:hypothetical protein
MDNGMVLGSNIMRIDRSEYEKTNSKYSSMRKAFFWMVKFGIYLTSFILISIITIAVLNATVTKESKIDIPIAALLGLPGIVFGAAFGGKAAQSFSETDEPESNPIEEMQAMQQTQTFDSRKD